MSAQLALDVNRPTVSLSEPLLTAPKAAELLSVRTSWIYEAVREGRLPCVRAGSNRIARASLA